MHDNSSAPVVSEACACGVGRFVVTGRALFLVGRVCTCIIFTRIRTCMTMDPFPVGSKVSTK